MTTDEVIDLLTVLATYDRRTVGRADVLAWHESAKRAGWTFDEALDAAHDHHAERTDWCKPGHITERIRASRKSDMPPRFVPQLDGPEAADDETRGRYMATIADDLAKIRARRRTA